MTDDAHLLQAYLEGSEPAFRELVARYVNLVYSAALRHLPEASLAEDVVQTVFTTLARKARVLPKDVILGGWLYRHTCFVAAQAARGERRRQAREKQAVAMNSPAEHPEPDWEQLSPFLDEAMQRLEARDRDAVVLRFFEKRDLHSVGAAMGITEEAARKRITRALEKLRTFFIRRGVTLSVTTLATLLTGHAVMAAPAGLALAASGAALAAASTGTGYSMALIKILTMTKLKIGMIGAVVAAAVVTPLILQHQSQARLRAADGAVQEQADRVARIQAENERLAALADPPKGQPSDLVRLRAEAGALRQQTNALPELRKENRRLQAAVDKPDVEPTPEQQQEVMGKMGYGKSAIFACILHSRTNRGLFPPNFAQIASALPEQMKAKMDPAGDAFEVVYHGSYKALSALTNAPDMIVIRQQQPSAYGNRWAKVYVCADGHCEIHTQADQDFSAWEKQHMLTTSTGGE